MPDILAGLESDWDHVAGTLRRLAHPRHHNQPPAPQPATAPETPHNGTQEEPPMSLVTDGFEHVKAAFEKFQQVDHEALTKFEAVTANPATNAIFLDLAAVAHLPLTAGELSTAENVIKMTLAMLSGQTPAPAQQPA